MLNACYDVLIYGNINWGVLGNFTQHYNLWQGTTNIYC